MCGIYGIYQFDGAPVVPESLQAMGDITRHRGPDDHGMHIDGACGIGMRRLSIIDLSGGHQPISNADGTVWVVCNGEIYNFRELRAELEAQGHRFKTHSDTEVMVHLYDRHGDAFVQHLNGMYNFALWDARRRRLLIGRDRLGVKPLYLLQEGKRFAFATEAKALLTLPKMRPELDAEALASYLHLGYVAAPHCLFKGMRKLPPATLMSIEDGKVEQWRYWQLPGQVDRSLSSEDWVSQVREHLDRSVRMQMVSDVPIGAFLSGGVDSSAVVAYMARHSDLPIKTYAIGFEGGKAEALYNELPYAKQVARQFGAEHHEIVVRPDVVGLLPKLLWHMDEPVSDSAFITTYLVSEFARKDVTVILSGVGGDELFGGYRRYLGNHYARHWQRLPGWGQALIAQAAAHLPSDRHSKWLNLLRLAKHFVASAQLGADERYRAYLQVFSQQAVSSLLLKPSGKGSDPLAQAFAGAGTADDLNRMFAVDTETQLPDDLLLLTDKMSMAVSLECRVPLLDHELAELAAKMPAEAKVPGGELKHILKAALADTLPKDILYRQKRGFGTPMGAWLKRELAPVLRAMLSREAVESRGWFNYSAIQALMDEHAGNRLDGTDPLLALMNLEIWSRVFLDRHDPETVADELKRFL